MFPIEYDKEDGRWFLCFAIAALVQAIVLFAISWNIAGGHFMFPLDDSYIHLQYARQFANNQPLVYTTGMAPSGGMTSPFYVLLMMPFFLAGLTGAKGAFAAFALGVLFWILTPIWTYQLVKRLSNCLAGAIAGILVLANGHLLWNFLSGMETGLYTILLLGAALAAQTWWQSERPHARLFALAFLAVLPLVRPEGIIAPVLLAVILLLRRGEEPRLSILPVLACFLPFLLWLAVLWLATGDWRPAGLIVKGLSSHPLMSFGGKLAAAGETLSAIGTRFYSNQIPDPSYAAFKGRESMPYIPMGVGLLALFASGWLVVREWHSRRSAGGTFLALLWIIGLASIAASRLPFVHQQRYLAPYTVLAIALAAVAIWRIAQLFQQYEETAAKAICFAFAVVSLPSLIFWTAEYGQNSRDIYNLLRVASFSLQQETQPAAMTDAGVLAYYSNTPLYDLIGLGSREFSHPVQHGEGSILEALGEISPQRRPQTVITYREWWGEDFPLGDPLWTVSIPRTTITSGTRISRFPILWERIDKGGELPLWPGMALLFELDVAELQSEKSAEYEFVQGPYDFEPRDWPVPSNPVTEFWQPAITANVPETTRTLTLVAEGPAVDGGRVVRGESFLFAPGRFPGGETELHLRVGSPQGPFAPRAQALKITITSNTTGYSTRRALVLKEGLPINAETLRIDIGDAFDQAGGTAWRVNIDAEPPDAAWTSYHYWITRRVPEALSIQTNKE